MHTPALATALAVALTLGPLPVAAQSAGPVAVVPAQWGQRRAVERDHFRRIYEQGYQAGMREGQRDARSRRRDDYRRHDDYRRGGRWSRNAGEANAYRQGFADGYREGVSRFSRGWGGRGYPNGPAYPGRTYPGYPGNRGGYPSYPGPAYPGRGYPGGGYPGGASPGGGYGYGSPAVQRGFEDGLREGQNAARRGERYDPVREKKYRDGDDGYNSRYGSRDRYKQEYRNAFRQGYDEGYRGGYW